MKVKALCVNDNNKPEVIPSEKWVKKDEIYNITYVYWHPNQGVQGVDLSEISLDGCEPYETYKLDRFAVHKKDIKKFIQLCKTCTEMNDIDISKLIETIELVET